MHRSSLIVLNGLLATFGVMLLAAADSNGRPGAHAQASLAYRAYVPGVSCDGCAPTPPAQSPTPSATSTSTAPAQGFSVVFIDVGQGDATLITVNGERLLIDAGRTGGFIAARLQALGVMDLDAILATHPDADHIGGFPAVLGLYDVERIYLNGGASDSQTFATFMNAVEAEDAQVATLTRGQSVALGGLQLPVLHPGVLTGNSNADSLVARLTCGSVDVLLTGDAEAPSESSMLAAGVLTDIDVLKVGHHGSNSSSTSAFLQAAKPEVAVISAGRTNQYGHPHAEVVTRLTSVGAALLYTDTTAANDSITMTSNCESYQFSAA
ncbi:MAG: ComEC/Rec2 family competence protein, partial [Dehalococcoidia bacterium]